MFHSAIWIALIVNYVITDRVQKIQNKNSKKLKFAYRAQRLHFIMEAFRVQQQNVS